MAKEENRRSIGEHRLLPQARLRHGGVLRRLLQGEPVVPHQHLDQPIVQDHQAVVPDRPADGRH